MPNFEEVDMKTLEKIEAAYLRYLNEIEANVNLKNAAEESRYSVRQFKEYKIAKSKKLIDEMDDLVGPLYGLNMKEVEYIKRYEEKFRQND